MNNYSLWLALIVGTWLSASLAAADKGPGHPMTTLHYPATTLSGEKLGFMSQETPREVRYELAGDVLFDFNKADIRPEAETALADLAARISARFGDVPIRVEGHTDSKGADAYNQTLSERRAQAIGRWLATEGRLSSERITPRGFGERRPVAPNNYPNGDDYPPGRQKNRRVEIVVAKR